MDSPEHERRSISEYVEVEAEDETVVHVEKVTSERVMGHKYDVWDVETDKNRWWVITNMTNLYLQSEFKSLDYLLSFHIGLMHRIMARQSQEPRTGDEERDRLMAPWRKWEQAGKAADEAEEAEDFQAVGMRCREALVAFVHASAADDMVPRGEEVPKKSDVVNWSEYIAAAVTPSSTRLRGYLRKTAGNTWGLVNWLTHEANAHKFDAVLAVDATAHMLDVFGMALVRHERGQPDRCLRCGSYRLVGDYHSDTDTYVTLCEACEWSSDPRDA